MNKIRTLFMGTPDFAVPCLEKLLASDLVSVTGVVSQPDRPKGRGHKLLMPPVKELAVKKELAVWQPERVKNPEFLAEIAKIDPDLIVVVAFGQILPTELLAIPTYGCINVHASLLPKYRGAAPMQWCLINGETKTGVTTMMMDAGLDTGDILLQESIDIPPDMDINDLTAAMKNLGADLLLKTVKAISTGELRRIPQNDSCACYAPLIQKETGRINWQKSAVTIHNLVRGLAAWPGAYGVLGGEILKIWHTELVSTTAITDTLPGTPGTIVDVGKQGIVVSTGDGCLCLTQVQAPGRKRMPAGDSVRGRGKLPTGFED